ncbi:MAG: hypothetical protein JWQ71_1484 [Pedosphaera sp.]|nr:hypothetical protein [Pedosphaera sp.]
MKFEEAIEIINKHSTTLSPESFLKFLLDYQNSDHPSLEKLEKINSEIIAALECINQESLSKGLQVIQINIILNITVILAEGWDMYSRWIKDSPVCKAFLDHYPEILSDWGFAWGRILDASTSDLKQALKNRRIYQSEVGNIMPKAQRY